MKRKGWGGEERTGERERQSEMGRLTGYKVSRKWGDMRTRLGGRGQE